MSLEDKIPEEHDPSTLSVVRTTQCEGYGSIPNTRGEAVKPHLYERPKGWVSLLCPAHSKEYAILNHWIGEY